MLAAGVLRKHPGLARAFMRYRKRYAQSSQFIAWPPRDCTIVHVAPAILKTTRTTRDPRTLEADYAQGRRAAERAIAAW